MVIKRVLSRNFYIPALLVSAFIIYWPILKNTLLKYWDDQWVVMNSYTTSGVNPENLKAILIDYYSGQYAPFNEYLYLFLFSINQRYDPFIFHLASLILHSLNSILVLVVLRKILKMSGKIEDKLILPIAFLTALIFCIHPLNVESVAWMSASKVLVYALFYLLATYAFLLHVETGKIKYYLLTILLYIFSFLGKEQAVTFPLWTLLIYWILGYDLSSKKIWLKILPLFILSLYFGIITIYSQYPEGSGFLNKENNYALWQRVIFGCYSYLEYIFKIVLPFKLSYLYPFPSPIGSNIPSWLVIYPILILVMILSFWKQFLVLRPVAACLLFFTIHIAVALHIIPLSRFVIIADRYAYVALIGIAALISYYLVLFYHKLSRPVHRILLTVCLLSYLIYCGEYAHRRTYIWYSTDTLKKEIRELLRNRNDYIRPGLKRPV